MKLKAFVLSLSIAALGLTPLAAIAQDTPSLGIGKCSDWSAQLKRPTGGFGQLVLFVKGTCVSFQQMVTQSS